MKLSSISDFDMYRTRQLSSARASWRDAATVVSMRWDAFLRSEAQTRAFAFRSYVAALDAEEAAAARKRQLIADLERERLVRRARRRHKPTYILTPREPEPRGPERLAA